MRATHTIVWGDVRGVCVEVDGSTGADADATTAAAARHFIRHKLWFTQAMLSFPFGMHRTSSIILRLTLAG